MKGKKIIIDTNIWISAFLKDPFSIYELIIENELLVYSCKQLRDELQEVMSRKKFNAFFSKEDIENALIIFDELTYGVSLKSKFRGCPDPKDDFLFALALQTESEIIITGDAKLLSFETDFVKTISFTNFKNMLSSI